MAIPDYQTLMLPLLRLMSDGQPHTLRDLVAQLSQKFQLTPQERSQLVPSGKRTVFYDRVGWAKTYLVQAGLLETQQRGTYRITPRGTAVLQSNLSQLDVGFLRQFPEFQDFLLRSRNTTGSKFGTAELSLEQQELLSSTAMTPEEQLEAAYQALRNNLAEDLLERVKQ